MVIVVDEVFSYSVGGPASSPAHWLSNEASPSPTPLFVAALNSTVGMTVVVVTIGSLYSSAYTALNFLAYLNVQSDICKSSSHLQECMTRKKDHDLRLANSLVTLLKYIETPCLLVCEETMVFSLQRLFILLICIGFFAVQSAKGSRLRSIDLFLRWSGEDDVSVLKYHHRTLKAVEMQAVNTEKKQAPVSKKFDPNQSSKRRVRKGSDPIHNRS